MKKMICLLMALLMLLSLAACGKEETEQPKPNFNPGLDDDTEKNNTGCPPWEKIIKIDTLDELEALRQMLLESDEEVPIVSEFGQFCERSDYEKFLDRYDTLPRLSLMEGEVTWIAQYGDDVMMITTENENGEWFRLGYQFAWKSVSELGVSEEYVHFFEEPIVTQDKRVTVCAEKRNIREDGMEVIKWYAELDGYVLEIFYGSNEKDVVTAQALFPKLTVIDPAG